MARHVTRGIRVDEEALAVDQIAQVAASDTFLTLKHTASNFRREFWFPQLLDRSRYGEWVEDGKQTMGDRIREQVRHLIAEHRAPALDNDATAKLDEIISSY